MSSAHSKFGFSEKLGTLDDCTDACDGTDFKNIGIAAPLIIGLSLLIRILGTSLIIGGIRVGFSSTHILR